MITAEKAILQLRKDPAYQKRIFDGYLDGNLKSNVLKFSNSEEFKETLKLLQAFNKGKSFLEIGAGPGFASFSFAGMGYHVISVEPDASSTIGAGAITKTALLTNKKVSVIRSMSQHLPFSNNWFDIVYFRQSLHHMPDLPACLSEVNRVLKPEGIVVSIREHVVSNNRQRENFLNKHPLHRLSGGENAYTLKTYKTFFKKSGFRLLKVIGPFASEINYYPFKPYEIFDIAMKRIHLTKFCSSFQVMLKVPLVTKALMFLLNSFVRLPGRNYSFFAIKAENNS